MSKRIITCGEEFCEACGDCLHCYDGEECTGTEGEWHVYPEKLYSEKTEEERLNDKS